MKRNLKRILALSILLIMLSLATISMASDAVPTSDDNTTPNVVTSTDDNNTTPTENTYELIASDIYKAEANVIIDQTIDGNVFAFGNNITISGEIGGDVFACGGNVTIEENAYIHGSIFACAKTLTLNGICYDVYAACGNFTMGNKSIVARDIRIGSDAIYISGLVKRDAYISTEQLVFPDNASGLIAGNLEYSAHSEFDIAEGVVTGNTKYTPLTVDEPSLANKIAYHATNILASLLYVLAVTLFVIWLAPNFKEKAGTILKKKAPLSFGVGILTCIVVIAGAFILLLTAGNLVAGISVAGVTLFILALTISKAIFGIACAKLINTKLGKDTNVMFILTTLLVVLVLNLLKLIPYLGALVAFIVPMIGLGIIVINLVMKKGLDDKSEESTTVEETK